MADEKIKANLCYPIAAFTGDHTHKHLCRERERGRKNLTLRRQWNEAKTETNHFALERQRESWSTASIILFVMVEKDEFYKSLGVMPKIMQHMVNPGIGFRSSELV